MTKESLSDRLTAGLDTLIPADTDLWPSIHDQLVAHVTPRPRRSWFVGRQAWISMQVSASAVPWRLRALVVGVILLGAVTLTPLRVVATNILHELGLVQITNEPTYADMIAAGQTPTPRPPSLPNVSFTFDLEMTELATLQAQAGYVVYHVSTLPPGSRVVDRDVQPLMDGEYTTAIAYQLSGESGMLMLIQSREGTLYTQVPVGNAQTEPVTINGNPGVWVEGVTFFVQDKGVVPDNKLIWNADGFTFELVGPPNKEVALQIAASVVPAQ